MRIDKPQARIDAHDAISIAAMTMGRCCDRRHEAKFFNVGDKVWLRLHKGYTMPDHLPRKYGQQYAGPLEVTERVGRLAYRLRLPPGWKIHDVISVDHLEPHNFDPFRRQLAPIQPVRTINQQIDRILSELKTRGQQQTQYLVGFDGLGQEFNQWMNAGMVL